ncbi:MULTISPECIES: IS5 family transposase [unclassified Sporosarcina]|uniref:IS5 family transposase n=1 Tax=unclassified Sporosarcina TaxID=2647733 RepID=UPI001A9299EE|nr:MULTISPECIES: IS5 family transposase [unclassified Sporosarcina]MBO0587579.1 IS5 family transposase [Sporosarcina sp. E16_8]MBO0602434.1 IS5 family transposase [Sporosarcina sp. E16_3]
MYEHNENQIIMPHEFFLPFGGQLNPDNRWVVMASLIPWNEVEEAYIETLGDTKQGSKAYNVRLALGSLIIKERLGLSDEETVEAITENPYLQYFIGLHSFQQTAPFHSSSMTHFRKRFNGELINELNESLVLTQRKKDEKVPDDEPPNGGGHTSEEPNSSSSMESVLPPNQGKLLLDATCAPSDITYPTDIGLLNKSREKLEKFIDTLHRPLAGKQKKPRTYRVKARKEYLSLTKQRKPGYQKIQEGIECQLGYVKRNLLHIEKLVTQVGLDQLTSKRYRDLFVIQEIYRQQSIMYKNQSHSIEDRIVSISQPHIRPIVRGKANAPVEFGAKLSVSLVDGYAFIDTLSWDAYHEGIFLKESIESYKERFGYYPEAVLADTIYRTRENRQHCKDLGIRLSGPKLGRPSKDQQINAEQKRIERKDNSDRNAIEGKFGEGKRKYGLGLMETSETVISLQFLIMNIEKILRDSFLPIFQNWLQGILSRLQYRLTYKVA